MSDPMAPWWAYFGGTSAPFTRDVPVERCFTSMAWREAHARIVSLTDDRGFGVLTCESGVGKTTALRAVLQPLNPARYRVCYVAVAEEWTPRQLYRALATELQLPWAPSADAVEQQVRHTCWTLATQQGQLPIVVLDEAHLLSLHVLQALRRLRNFAFDTTAPMVLILAGHTELRRKLALRPLEAVRQRVTLAYHLPPLTAADAAAYVRHHLQQVGITRPVFSDAPLQAGYTWSQGIPRRLNQWARAALMAAHGGQHSLVDDAVVAIAEAELQWAGTIWYPYPTQGGPESYAPISHSPSRPTRLDPPDLSRRAALAPPLGPGPGSRGLSGFGHPRLSDLCGVARRIADAGASRRPMAGPGGQLDVAPVHVG